MIRFSTKLGRFTLRRQRQNIGSHLVSFSGLGGGDSPPNEPPAKPSLVYRLTEDFKDVLSVTFGWERKRNIEEELDKGLRVYPWITYPDPITGAPSYRNTDTGAVTEVKPLDFDRRATAASFKQTNTQTSSIMNVTPKISPWERTLRALGSTPLIQQILAVGEVVSKGPVGQVATKIKDNVSAVREDLQEKWETSQHP